MELRSTFIMISLFTYTHLPIYVLSPQSILSEMAMSPADTISMCPEPELDLLSSVWVLQGSHHGGRMKAPLQSCSCSPLTSLVDMLDNRRMCSGGWDPIHVQKFPSLKAPLKTSLAIFEVLVLIVLISLVSLVKRACKGPLP